MRKRPLILTSLVAVAAVTVATPSAVASEAPAFLKAKELPPHPSSPWYAGPVTSGVPDPLPFCVGAALPGATSKHRNFRTEYDTSAVQVTVVERNETRAKALAALLNKAVRKCAARTEQQDPDIRAKWRDYGRVKVEEGARVYGVQTSHAWTGNDIHLFAVGRDDHAVTIVHWGQMGTFADAPVRAFKKTTRIAVDKL